jgi:hypothetical protein
MSINNLNQKLTELRQIKDSLSYLFKEEFQTDIEFQTFRSNHLQDFDKYKITVKEIKEIEWQLMSPQQRKEYLEEQQKIKEKYADD